MKLFSIMGNSQKLDGGAMYGNAPKALWSRYSPADEQNRIDLACRCLLVKSGSRLILFETGIGVFFAPSLRERYGVQETEHILLKNLQKKGYSEEEITDVVLSHLHFDHTGGLLTAYEEGKKPQLLFPKARYYVGEQAFERAKNPHFRDRASFIPELPELLIDSKRLEIIRDPQQHSLAPEIRFRFSEGHTPGLMMAELRGTEKRIVFVSDMIPGSPWVHIPITMGYDRYPEKLIDEKQQFLAECVAEKIYLYFTHDPKYATAQVKRDEQGRFSVIHPEEVLEGWEI